MTLQTQERPETAEMPSALRKYLEAQYRSLLPLVNYLRNVLGYKKPVCPHCGRPLLDD